jgi:hypothetical protein
MAYWYLIILVDLALLGLLRLLFRHHRLLSAPWHARGETSRADLVRVRATRSLPRSAPSAAS